MSNPDRKHISVGHLLSQYGMLLVLFALCGFFSIATIRSEQPTGVAAALDVARQVDEAETLVIVCGVGSDAEAFADTLIDAFPNSTVITISGSPADVRMGLNAIAGDPRTPQAILATAEAARWGVLTNMDRAVPGLASVPIIAPDERRVSAFLKSENLKNVLNQITVIAITAIGMTLVIITAGIDLSVGSLIALSAVLSAYFIRAMGGTEASMQAMLLASAGAVAICGAVGAFSGVVIAKFKLPPFIATLGIMQIASGLAYLIAKGQSIYEIPDSYTWLGRGATLLTIPNAVVLMIVAYAAGHFLMTKTITGRALYAVGGNPEAARLSGVPVGRTLIFAYVISGLCAGLGGVILASQLKSGAPTYGQMYELYVIAAVVVGGTSLAGGEGNVIGTLIGALIIAVIQNGMNLTGVESYTQKVVLGGVILGAVLLDMVRRNGFKSLLKRSGAS